MLETEMLNTSRHGSRSTSAQAVMAMWASGMKPIVWQRVNMSQSTIICLHMDWDRLERWLQLLVVNLRLPGVYRRNEQERHQHPHGLVNGTPTMDRAPFTSPCG